MTQLKLEEYCQGCKFIKPEAEVNSFYIDSVLYDSTVFIVCKSAEKCRHLHKMLARKLTEGSGASG